MIQLFVSLVLHGPTSFRGASGALSLFVRCWSTDDVATPWPNSGCLWLLRLGLYELTRPLERADDWIWIVDHTIQVGTFKCLLILGCSRSQWEKLGRAPTPQDMTVVALEPAETSKAEVVRAEFEKAASRTGPPRAILSDGARDLKRAIEDFRELHPSTANLSDAKHKIALLIKHELERDDSWKVFVTRSTKARSQLMQDPLAYLVPPSLKAKARYMNLEPLLNWATRVRDFLERPVSPDGQELNVGKLNLTLGWIREFDEELVGWDRMLRTAEAAMSYLRRNGYHAEAVRELTPRLDSLAVRPQSRRLADALLEFVAAESAKAQCGEKLPASSEVIESLIGTGKRLEGQQSRSGFTKLALGMAAAVVTPTKQFIQQAFAAVTTQQVFNWSREKLGMSLQAKRLRTLGTRRNDAEQKPNKNSTTD